jgi:uncharacterized membrane protein
VDEQFAKNRVEALSDGIFAIVLTLLVLELRVPHIDAPNSADELATALWDLMPKFVAWVISFVTVCVIYLNHHRLFSLLSRLDHSLFWRNANLLFWTTAIGFATALMGDYASNRLAVSFYGIVGALMALGFVLFRLRCQARPDDLLLPDVDRAGFRVGTRYSIVLGPIAYLVGAALAWVLPALAFAVYGGIALYFVFPHAVRNR